MGLKLPVVFKPCGDQRQMAKMRQGTAGSRAKVMKQTKQAMRKKGQALTAKHIDAMIRNAEKLTPTGQHQLVSLYCISTTLDGKPCPKPRAQEHIPYCKDCMRTGDPSLRSV